MNNEWFQEQDGKVLVVRRQSDSNFEWKVWGVGIGFISGMCSSEDLAKREAERVSGIVSEPPAPPAWMVEVAREIGARICERQSYPQGAKAYRDGDHDNSNGVQDSVSALRLALERGHVVEREGGSSLSLIAMKGPMHRAWRAGFRSARTEARALLDSIQLDDKAEANCTRHVNDILRTLPTRGA